MEASLARAERLRQSILKQAFSGKLVPQDPDDEPASALLERIKAEREAEAEANAVTLGLGCYDRTHQAYAGLVPRDDNLPFCATPSLRRSRTAPASGRLVTGDESAKATS